MSKIKKKDQLILDNKELAFRIEEKEKQSAELIIANTAFAKQQALFASIIDSSDDAILSKTLEGKITSWNQGAEKNFGYTAKEIIGKNISILIPAHLLNEEKEIIRKINNGELVKHYETERRRKDGKIIHVSLTISPIKDSDGTIIGISKISRDITQQKHAEKELIANEKQFRHMFDNLLEGIQIHDFDWRYIYVNNPLVKYSSYSKEELIGHTLMEKYPGIEQTKLFKTLERCMNERVSEYFETEFMFPNGTKVFFELNIQPIPEGISILSIDVTERKKAEEKLIKTNRLYSFISHINQSILHTTNEQDLFLKACTIATKTGKFKMAWIGILDEKGILNMVRVEGDLSAIKNLQKYSSMDFNNPILRNTPTGKVFKTGKYGLSNDVQNDPAMKPWKEEFEKHGIKANISLPLKKFGKVIGVFGFNSTTKNYFDKEEIKLLEEAAGEISFALDVFEKEKLRKQAEDLLIQNEARLNKSQSIAHLGHWELDFATGIVILSEESCKIYGLDSTDNKQSFEVWTSFIHPEDVDFVMKLIKEQHKSLNETSFDHRIVRKDGVIRHIHAQSKFEFDSNGKPIILYGINYDITEQKLSEKKLKQSEAKLIKAQALAHVGNWEIDFTDNKYTWSKEMYHIFGISSDKVTPSTELFLSFIHPEDADFAHQKMQEAFDKLINSSFNFRFIQNEKVRYGYSEWRFVFDNNNKPMSLYGIVQDITEKKHAEDERTKMIDHIIQRNKDLEQFTYIVSHNLRAPIANIIGISELLQESEHEGENEKEIMGDLSTTVKKLDNVIKDLNYILQIKHELSEKKELVKFSELVRNIKTSISNLIKKEDIEIISDFSEVNRMFTIKSYLYSIFYNLISNSIKYKRASIEPRIEIKSYQINNKIILTFRDNGLGIDLDKKGDQVFGLYKRFHTHTEGKGMGLFIVKTQVETLGGKISIKSEVNKGTEFEIEFTAET